MSQSTLSRDLDTLHVLVAFGGDSAEADGSALSAETVRDALTPVVKSVELADLNESDFIDRARRADVVFNACHGLHGEDGALQGALDLLRVPYTGSGALTSAVSMDKVVFKQLMRANRLPTAPWATVSVVDDVPLALAAVPGPWFVKPVNGGESFASGPARTAADVEAIITGHDHAEFQRFLVEPLIDSPTYTVAVWPRDGRFTDLPILEARTTRAFYDSAAKQDPNLRSYVCPAELPPATAEEMVRVAWEAYRVTQATGLVRVDFLVWDGEPVVLEANTVPGLSRQGNLGEILRASGEWDLDGFIVAELRTVLEQPTRR